MDGTPPAQPERPHVDETQVLFAWLERHIARLSERRLVQLLVEAYREGRLSLQDRETLRMVVRTELRRRQEH